MAVLGALPLYYLLGATFLAAVSLLLERGPLPFLQRRKRPDSLFHEKSSSFYGDGVYVARECQMIKVF